MGAIQFYGLIGLAFLTLFGGAIISATLIERSKCTSRNLSQKIEITEKRNEIANNRPDRSGVVKRLRASTF